MSQLAVGVCLHELAVTREVISPFHGKSKLGKVKDQIEEIWLTLKWVKVSLLKDADERQIEDESVRRWVVEIKALAYRIEDVIERLVIRVEGSDVNKFKGKRIKSFLGRRALSYSAVDAEAEIEDIVSKLRELSWRSRLRPSSVSTHRFQSLDTSRDDKSRGTSPSNHADADAEHLVGMKEDIERLVTSVLDETKNYQVISICGMVGIGKTTLARQVWSHHRTRDHFDSVAWVHVTQDLSTATIFGDILRQLLKDQFEKSKATKDIDDIELAYQLYNSQRKQRYLIVLDDVQSTDALERLRIPFPWRKKGSKILITTRSLEVANSAAADEGLVHTMSCLSEDDGWKLFIQSLNQSHAPEVMVIDSEMENIGREIVKRYKGLPQVIVALGEEFRSKSTLESWKIAHENYEVLEGIDKLMLRSLTSVYAELPYELKSCLLYLATYRKSTEIKSEKLYHLWMAEGIVSSDNYQSDTLMHMAEWYLSELSLRFMVDVQEEEIPTAGTFKSCSLHDLVYDFCLSIGRKEEFLLVMENEPQQNSDSSWTEKVRVILYVGSHNNSRSLDHLSTNLRVLLVRNVAENQESVPDEMLSGLLNCIVRSKLLRILDFDRINFGSWTLPEEKIGELVHLRYVSFMGCLLKTLPASIAYLPYLQILDLRVEIGCELEIPNVLHKMKRLRHLYLPLKFRTHGGVKLRLDGLTQLETLENFNTEVCDVEDLFSLTKLWYLTTITEGSLKTIKKMISLLYRTSEHKLRSSLDVRNFDCYAEERHSVFRQLLASPALHVLYMEGHLGQIPPYRKISKNLTKIVLSGSELQMDPMPILEKLPNLQVLILHDDAFVGKEMICSASQFPELKSLELSNLCDLESWRLEERAMPKLSTLVIENCRQLIMVPDGLRVLTNLHILKIQKMPKTFEDSFRGVDIGTVARKTLIIFDN